MNSRNVCTFGLITLTVVSTLYGDGNDGKPRRQRSSKHNYFVRCTRRFTPGLCIEPVMPVWTFVFQLQNCTERYGCLQDWRTNRFTTYNRCMRRCKPLIDFYTEILSRDPENLTAYIRSQPWNKSGRRDAGDDEDGTDVEEEEYIAPKIGDGHFDGPRDLDDSDNLDRSGWAMTLDIDGINT